MLNLSVTSSCVYGARFDGSDWDSVVLQDVTFTDALRSLLA